MSLIAFLDAALDLQGDEELWMAHGSSAENFHFFFAAKPLWTAAA